MSSGTSLPHILIVGPHTEDPSDRETEVIHHHACPVEHFYGYAWRSWLGLMPYHYVYLACSVQREIDANGIDSLYDPDTNREWRTWTWRKEQVGLDQTLPPGRYLFEGWWSDGAGMGEYGGQGEADRGLTLLGPVPAHAERALPGVSEGQG